MAVSAYRLYQRGRVWYVEFADQPTYHSTGETHRKAAEAYALDIVAGKVPGRAAKLTITLGGFSLGFFEAGCKWSEHRRAHGHACSPATAGTHRRNLDNHVFPTWGKLLLHGQPGPL